MNDRDRPSLPLIAGLAFMILAGVVVLWANSPIWGQGPLTTGWDEILLDSDDAARIVQVRDLAQGQGWFDLRQMRLGADQPVLMHWSRLLDAPLLVIYWAAEAVVGPDQAERAMAVLWPRIVLFLWLALSLVIAGQLAGRRGVWCAAFLLVPVAMLEGEFRPGRVDHHSLQLLLVLAAVSAAIAAERRPAMAALAGCATALSLAVGLETLPVLAAAGGVVALAWALGDGPRPRQVAVWYSLGLGLAVPVAMATTLPPMTLTTPLCDQLSPATAVPIGIATLGLVGFTVLLRGARWALRVASLAVLAVSAIAIGVAIAPACLSGPYAAFDAEIAEGMAEIVERRTLLENLERDFGDALYRLVVWPAVGLIGLGAAMLHAPRGRRFAPTLLFGTALMATAVAYVEVRGHRLALPLTFFGGVLLLDWATRWRGAARAAKPVAALVLVFAVTPLGMLAKPGFDAEAPKVQEDGTVDLESPEFQEAAVYRVHTCMQDAETAPLAALPPGRVLATINYGAHILLKTPHHVIAAPYHRNIEGLRVGFRLAKADSSAVRAMAEVLDADYLVYCRNPGKDPEPGSLLEQVREGRTPPWLTPLAAGERLLVFRIEPDGDTVAAPATLR